MIRRIAAALALAALSTVLPPNPVLPGSAAAVAAPDLRALPMRFEWRQEAPADACAASCRRWISAFGAITADTPHDFRAFAEGKDLRGSTIALESDGGSVLGALALGREIRRLKLTTTVGRTVADGSGAAQRLALDPHADCESMCAFVLLAGVARHVPAEARVMVHQIWLGDRRDDPTAASYSAEDLVLVQRDIGRIAQYIAEMGASAELLDLALRIPPWEPMRRLMPDELRALGIVTRDDLPDSVASHPPPAETRAVAAALTALSADAPRAGSRAWRLIDGPGGATLTRRHPLTVEGDEIGAFDITVACGPGLDRYLLSYSERRRAAAGVPPAAPALSAVTVDVGRTVTALRVAGSRLDAADAGAFDSFASGTVPKDVLGLFADAGSRSLVVSTEGRGAAATSIRIGNTGFAQSWPLLAASCAKLSAARDDAASAGGGTRTAAKTGALAHAE
jgi:hypothetical protein